MKKFFTLFLLLFALVAPSPSRADYVSMQGITVDVPAGWTVESGEEMLIYNQNESSVVIISSIAKNFESSLKDVVKNFGQAVGVPKKEIQYDRNGSALMSFMQDGEKVNVRLLEENGTVLMVCAIGKDSLTAKVAESVTTQPSGKESTHRQVRVVPNSKDQIIIESP